MLAPDSIAFIQGIVLGLVLGLFLSYAVIPLTVDLYLAAVRRMPPRRRHHRRGR